MLCDNTDEKHTHITNVCTSCLNVIETCNESIIGDVLFLIANISVLSSLNPEEALRKANKRFLKKLGYVEKNSDGLDIKKISPKMLNFLWEKAANAVKK